MRDPTHQQLLGYLFRRLEEEEQACFDRRFEQDEEFRRKLGLWRLFGADRRPSARLRASAGPGGTDVSVGGCLRGARGRGVSVAWDESRSRVARSAAHASWSDVAAVSLLFLTACFLILPAISEAAFARKLSLAKAICSSLDRPWSNTASMKASRSLDWQTTES